MASETLRGPDLTDPENPEWTVEDFARAKRAADVLPPALYEALTKKRGRPKLDNPKVEMKLRLDSDIVAAFKADGPGWQTRINETLKLAVLAKRA